VHPYTLQGAPPSQPHRRPVASCSSPDGPELIKKFSATRRAHLHNRRVAAETTTRLTPIMPLTCNFAVGSSSPLRGFATWSYRRGVHRFRRPHRPYEGSQRESLTVVPVLQLRPHRPYEGSQHHDPRSGTAHITSSSPLQGFVTECRWSERDLGAPSSD